MGDNFIIVFYSQDDLWSKYLEYLIKHEEGKLFREVLQSGSGVDKLIAMALATFNLNENLTQGGSSISHLQIFIQGYDMNFLY